MVFWDNVKRILKLQNLTQSELADAIGVSVPTLKGWISKEIEPRVSDAVKIAETLRSSVEALESNGAFGGVNEIYSLLNGENKRTVYHLAEWLLARQNEPKDD